MMLIENMVKPEISLFEHMNLFIRELHKNIYTILSVLGLVHLYLIIIINITQLTNLISCQAVYIMDPYVFSMIVGSIKSCWGLR